MSEPEKLPIEAIEAWNSRVNTTTNLEEEKKEK